MDTILIETMNPAYLDQVIALQNTILPFEIDPVQANDAYTQMLSDENTAILVARRGDEILGTVTAICCTVLATKLLVIEDVVVTEHLRGMGIGGKLMDAADNFARKRGCTYAILVSSGFRKEAHRFYEKHGFVEDVRGFRKGY